MVDWLKSEDKSVPHYQKVANLDHLKEILRKPNGLIIVGDVQHQAVDQILSYATIHDVPILADPLSQLRKQHHPNVITTYDLLYRVGLDLEPDYIIRVGKPVISKALNKWIKRTSAYQMLVQNNDAPDAFPVTPHVSYEISINDFFRQLNEVQVAHSKTWLAKWQTLEKHAKIAVRDYIAQATDESAYVASLLDKLTEDDALFVSNSMPIRDIDNLYIDCKAEVFANRGANGIDGVVSTALGMAVHRNVTLLIGDLAFYHDMNGLLMGKLNDIHMNIVLLNNDGGGIFSYLPQKTEAAPYFERLFGTPTGLDFEHAALLYDYAYTCYQSIASFKCSSLTSWQSNLYEIRTDRADNCKAHQNLYQKLDDIVNVTL